MTFRMLPGFACAVTVFFASASMRAQELEVPRIVPGGKGAFARIERPGGHVFPMESLGSSGWLFLEPLSVSGTAGFALLPAVADSGAAAPIHVDVRGDGVVRFEKHGKLVTQLFHGADQPRPYFHPLLMPDGARLSRNWPMEEGPDEAKDHPHHRGLWFTFGEVNGIDFWSESERSGTIRQEELVRVHEGAVHAEVVTRNAWVARDGHVVCRDERTFRIYDTNATQLFDYEITIQASEGDVTFGDTKEGMMAIRLAPTMRLKGKVATGSIVNAAGDRDGATWGKRAAWCHYTGTVGDERYGIAIFDHPDNLRHPTWWHVRDYGLFAANPFGLQYFERGKGLRGEHTIPKGESLTFRYRFLMHEGEVSEDQLDRLLIDWAHNTLR